MKQKLFLDAAESVIMKNNYLVDTKRKAKMKISKFKVDKTNEKQLGCSKGDYYMINYDSRVLFDNPNVVVKELMKVLKTFMKNYKQHGTTLIIGLGNSSILADALGPITTKQIIATNHYDDFLTIPKIALFVPEVIGKTGISSFNLIKMLVNDLKPDVIIIIDSYATTRVDRLNYTLEVSDAGIIPGSAIKNNKEINAATFNVPVIAIGVPLLLEVGSELYTKPDIKNVIEASSKVISEAINKIYF